MATTLKIRRRAVGGAAGAPASAKSGEPAYNMQDGILYIGYGDDGGGNATSVKAFAKDDFWRNVPSGAGEGQVLSFNGGNLTWVTPSVGTTYTASENGIELVGSQFQLNYGEIATGISLSNYLTTANAASTYETISNVNTGLSLKVNKAGDTLTGKLITATPGTGEAGINFPHGAAPSAPVNGDFWTTTTGALIRINGATKTVAFTDSNITGSAATLTTSRNFSISGGGITAAAQGFNGSGNVVLSASVDAGHITLARMANLAANSFIGNNTGSAATPVALTTAQAKALLSISFTDVSGTATTAQIPSLDAAKITTGTFTTAQIPNLDASKITSGVLDIARIPVLPGSQVIVSSGSIADLSAPQQAEIDEGSIITTTDGRRWVYSGSGSKTLEASYVELADVTPEWTVIANKPTFATVATTGQYNDLLGRPTLATVATTGSYNDLTNRPTLGTMASQNANAVAITGGTIDGVTLDGGTF